MKNFDIVIVGNSVLGLSVAFALQLEEPGLRICIVGPSQRTGAATLAAGAMLGCYGEVNKATFGSDFHRLKFDLARQATGAWPSWLDKLNDGNQQTPVTITPGTFIILNAKLSKRDSQNYDAIIKALDENHEPYQDVDPDLISGLHPAEDCRPLKALYLPGEGAINPNLLLNALQARLLNSKQIEFVNATVTKLNISQDRIDGVRASDGTQISAAKTLLCAGAYTQALLDQVPQLKHKIPQILAGVGYSFVIKQDALATGSVIRSVIRTPNRAAADGLHAVPYADGELYIGASNYLDVAPHFLPRIRHQYHLYQYAMEQLNQAYYDAEIVRWNVGNRPVTIDTFPLIGKTSVAGLWLLAGTYRDGLHDSPILAQTLALQLLRGTPTFLDRFAPERSPICTMTRQQAIASAAAQSLSAGVEQGMKVPQVGWDMNEMLRHQIELSYERLGLEVGVPIEVLLMIERGGAERVEHYRQYYRQVGLQLTKTP